ncbi:MAG TPA: hypothetical protein V6D18_00910 [Thermosynechococcaceae cyanobacterium]
MNILPMLARLENALGRTDLTKQMVLIPHKSGERSTSEEINLVVGYNGSPRSQTALDLTLWIAHQTRLVTRKPVTVQVVYVADLTDQGQRSPKKNARSGSSSVYADSVIKPFSHSAQPSSVAVAEPLSSADPFDHADRVLWQARNLAEEWRGSLKTHLRFGQVARELRQIVQSESGVLLLVGCESPTHALVHQLGAKFPCPVLGIPTALVEPDSV